MLHGMRTVNGGTTLLKAIDEGGYPFIASSAPFFTTSAIGVITAYGRCPLIPMNATRIKSDVNLKRRLLTVERSYDRATSKGGRADVIPIALELVPYLETAVASSNSPLLFPRPDGSMHRPDIPLEDKLRRAMGRAELVEG